MRAWKAVNLEVWKRTGMLLRVSLELSQRTGYIAEEHVLYLCTAAGFPDDHSQSAALPIQPVRTGWIVGRGVTE